MSVESLITQHIDIWTSSVQTKSTAGRGTSSKLDLYGIKKLRELILELAVRGKLVPQDPNDEPASVLLERIEIEKKRLIKEKIIRKPKVLSHISQDMMPFEIPSSWKWCHLNELGSIVGGGTPKSGESAYWCDEGVHWLTPADLYGLNEKFIGRGKRDITELGLAKSSAQLLPKGSVLFSSRAPIGYVAISSNELATNQGFKSVVPFIGGLSEYIYYFLKRSAKYIDAEASGTTFKEVSGAIVSEILAPLPPLNELSRIVAKVDELMKLCDQLEQQTEVSIAAHQVLVETLLATLTNSADAEELMENWQRISAHFDTLFTTEESIDQLKQTILQLAVMGKLVPQNPADEPASELLKRIAKEKAQLVKEGKIKKHKALPPITDDEKPFELPDGWEWCRFGQLFKSFSNGLYKPAKFYTDAGVISLRMFNIQNGNIDFEGVKRVEVEAKELEQFVLEKDDLLINRVNSKELVGKTALIPASDEPLVYESMNMRAKPVDGLLCAAYLNLFMMSSFAKETIFSFAKEAVGQASINQGQVSSILTPLPPLNEQRKIFAKTDELLLLCERLKVFLKKSQTAQLHVTDALIEKAI